MALLLPSRARRSGTVTAESDMRLLVLASRRSRPCWTVPGVAQKVLADDWPAPFATPNARGLAAGILVAKVALDKKAQRFWDQSRSPGRLGDGGRLASRKSFVGTSPAGAKGTLGSPIAGSNL